MKADRSARERAVQVEQGETESGCKITARMQWLNSQTKAYPGDNNCARFTTDQAKRAETDAVCSSSGVDFDRVPNRSSQSSQLRELIPFDSGNLRSLMDFISF